jgi:hypothetical protein
MKQTGGQKSVCFREQNKKVRSKLQTLCKTDLEFAVGVVGFFSLVFYFNIFLAQFF